MTRRLVFAVLSVLGLITIVFVMIKIIPGDEARVAAGDAATDEQVEAIRLQLGLDQPMPVQYVAYLGRLLSGDLGRSITTFQPIATDLGNVLPFTLELVCLALVFTVLIAIPLGTAMAANQGKAGDVLGRTVIVLFAGMPVFWVAFMLQLMLAHSRVLPTSGSLAVQYSVPRTTGFLTLDALLAGDTAAFGDAVAHLILPALVLAVPQIAVIVRTMRTSLLGELDEDYVLMAQSKGASRGRILMRHALRNAAMPAITTLGLQVGYLISGAVIVESVFARPGIGAYLTSAVTQKDSFAVLGSVLFIGVVVITVSFLVDLLQMFVDPRVRHGQLTGAAA